jgi:hypothetical protein
MSTPPPGDRKSLNATGQPSATALLIQRHLSAPRLATYVRATGGDLDRAVELYLWNAAVTGALWEVLGHVEVVLRNVLHDALTARHQRLDRAGQWYDDPARELSQHARDDISRAKQRLQRAGAPLLPGKIVAELSFGFWRFLLARRYTATLWPALRPAFPYMPGSDRRLLEAPVARLHVLRNRVAHHEPLLAEPLDDRYTDLLDVVEFVHPQLRSWLDIHNHLLNTLARRP